MEDIVLKLAKLREYEKRRKEGLKPEIVIGMGQKIHLENHIIYNWKIEEELEGICTLYFYFKSAKKRNNMNNGFFSYQITRNADGIPMLIRVS